MMHYRDLGQRKGVQRWKSFAALCSRGKVREEEEVIDQSGAEEDTRIVKSGSQCCDNEKGPVCVTRGDCWNVQLISACISRHSRR